MAKSKWLNGQLNGTGKDAQSWRGGMYDFERPGNSLIKSELLANLKKQMNLPQSHSFVAGK